MQISFNTKYRRLISVNLFSFIITRIIYFFLLFKNVMIRIFFNTTTKFLLVFYYVHAINLVLSPSFFLSLFLVSIQLLFVAKAETVTNCMILEVSAFMQVCSRRITIIQHFIYYSNKYIYSNEYILYIYVHILVFFIFYALFIYLSLLFFRFAVRDRGERGRAANGARAVRLGLSSVLCSSTATSDVTFSLFLSVAQERRDVSR